MTYAHALKKAWVARMQLILSRIGGPVILLWLTDHRPEETADECMFASSPMFVDRKMLNSLADKFSGLVEVVSTEEEVIAGFDRMVFAASEELAACEMLGPIIHETVAAELQRVILDLQQKRPAQ